MIGMKAKTAIMLQNVELLKSEKYPKEDFTQGWTV